MEHCLLTLEGVVVGWHQPVLGPLSGVLQRGEVLGIGGPNGVGKSTLLAAIAGQAEVFAGALRPAKGVRLAWQTQQQPAFSGVPLTGREWLSLAGSSDEGLPDWLENKLDWRLDALSGGQRQYLALWGVLGCSADILLLDEPSNNLDRAGSAHLAQAIRARAARGAGIVLVSHEAALLAAACDRCLDIEVQDVA